MKELIKTRWISKSFTVEAIELRRDNIEGCIQFCAGALEILEVPKNNYERMTGTVKITINGEGFRHVKEGDYIIKGIHGEHYPVGRDLFDMTFKKECVNFNS